MQREMRKEVAAYPIFAAAHAIHRYGSVRRISHDVQPAEIDSERELAVFESQLGRPFRHLSPDEIQDRVKPLTGATPMGLDLEIKTDAETWG
jgi:hypothetical protein